MIRTTPDVWGFLQHVSDTHPEGLFWAFSLTLLAVTIVAIFAEAMVHDIIIGVTESRTKRIAAAGEELLQRAKDKERTK